MRRGAIVLIGVWALAGCESGETAEVLDFGGFGDEFFLILDANAEGEIIAPSELPTAGSATYEGVAIASTPEAGFAGNITLRADFEDNAISGGISNIVDDLDQRFTGSLDVENGVIDRDAITTREYTYEADLNGTLINSDNETVRVDGFLAGDFIGTGAEATAGIVGGSVTGPLGTETFEGGFIADR